MVIINLVWKVERPWLLLDTRIKFRLARFRIHCLGTSWLFCEMLSNQNPTHCWLKRKDRQPATTEVSDNRDKVLSIGIFPWNSFMIIGRSDDWLETYPACTDIAHYIHYPVTSVHCPWSMYGWSVRYENEYGVMPQKAEFVITINKRYRWSLHRHSPHMRSHISTSGVAGEYAH